MPHNTTHISSHVSPTLHQLSCPTASMRMTSRLRCIAKALLTILSIRRRGELNNMLFMGKKRISSCFQEMSGNVSLFQWMIYVIWWYLMVFEAYSKFLPSIMGNSMTVLPKQLPKTCFQDGSSMTCSTEIPGAQLCVFFLGVAISWSQKHISHFWWEHVGRIDIIIICKMNLKDCWVIFDHRPKWMMFHIHRKTSANKCIYYIYIWS